MCTEIRRQKYSNITVCKSPKLETTQVSRNIKMGKQTMIQSFKRKVFNTGHQLKINATRG